MRLGKAGGEDMVLAEYLKYGGPRLQQEVFRTVLELDLGHPSARQRGS